MSYVAPVKDMLFCMKELAGLEAIAAMPGFEDAGLDTAEAVLEECANFNQGVVAPLNVGRRSQPVVAEGRQGHDIAGLQGGVSPVRRRRVAGHAASGRIRRPGPAEDDRRGLHRDAQQREHELCAVSASHRWRDRGLADRGHAGAAGALSAEDDLGRVDRHDEPDRTAGRLGPRVGADPRRAAARRQLSDLRDEDLHHLRRARHGRQHRAPRAGARGRRAGGREGNQPLHRAEVHSRRPTARRGPATMSSASASNTSSASRRARRPCCSSAMAAARRATWSARRTTASSTCSS